MEISVKDEVDIEISPHGFKSDVKGEQSPTGHDENECTPLRDDNYPTTEPTFYSTCNAGWGSDADDDTAIKHSPTNDYVLTPIRVSEAEQPNSADTQLESQPNGDVPDIPDNFLDDLEADAMPTAIVKAEERSEFPLDFLSVRSTADLQCATNTCSRKDQLDDLDLERPPTEPYNEYTEEELSERIDQRVKQLEKLEKKKKKNKKNKKKDSHKKRRRSPSRSPQSSRKEQRIDQSHISSASRYHSIPQVKAEPADLDYIPVRDIEKSVEVVAPSTGSRPAAAASSSPQTIKEKRKRAVERATEVLRLLRLHNSKAPATEFLVVDTYIIKPPTRASHTSNDIFQCPSPLCNNFNVKYKFNSTTASNIDVSKWGLQRLPEETTQLLRITGIDATRLMELMKNSKMDLHKLRSQQVTNKAEDESASTGLYTSVSTQTDAFIRCRDVAIQATQASAQGAFWEQPGFNEIPLMQSQADVTLALKELCSRMPRSRAWADIIFQPLRQALKFHRAEAKEFER